MKVILPGGKEVEVINVMADGTICEDLSTYLNDHELPEDAARMVVHFVREGRKLLEPTGG